MFGDSFGSFWVVFVLWVDGLGPRIRERTLGEPATEKDSIRMCYIVTRSQN